MKLIKDNYEKGYHDHFLYRETTNSQRNQARLKLLLKQKQGGTLLEIGCGKAGFLQMAENSFQSEGMDISEHVIEAIRPHFGERVRKADLETDSLPVNHYDVVAVFNILEHLRQPGKAINKIFNSLRPGGIMIGSVPNKFSLVGNLVTIIGNFFDRTHISTYPPQTWRLLFTQAGFLKVDFFGEITIGPNHNTYLFHKLWPYLSFNLMFICRTSEN